MNPRRPPRRDSPSVPRRRLPAWGRAAFTLVELLISMAILSLILVLTFQITSGTSGLWQRTRSRIETFQEARASFESVTRRLNQATLGTYWDYADAGGKTRVSNDANFTPQGYVRQSDLHFVSGQAKDLLAGVPGMDGEALRTVTHAVFFQAPLGYSSPGAAASPAPGRLPNLLNVCGYFVEVAKDDQDRPRFLGGVTTLPVRRRYRLIEVNQPAERFQVYRWTGQTDAALLRNWFREPLKANDPPVRRVLAENIIALVLHPKRAARDTAAGGAPAELAPAFDYDTRGFQSSGDSLAKASRHQLPPVIQVTMVAVDEKSIQRLEAGTGGELPDFGLENKFLRAADYTRDLTIGTSGESLEDVLVKKRVNYRVFTTEVSILQAKWSEK